MPTLWPLLIPSKGRAGRSRLLQQLNEKDLTVTVLVEPQDYAAYRAAYPRLETVCLAEDGRGIAYARNGALTLAAERGMRWYWMLDDDITLFYKLPFNKDSKVTLEEALGHGQTLPARGVDVAQIALGYQNLAYMAFRQSGREFDWNSYCDVCVAVNVPAVKKAGISYRNIGLKEDRDFTLQLLAAGLNTLRSNVYGFACPTNGSNAGGLQAIYAEDGREYAEVKKMAEMWPGIVDVHQKPNGRIDCKINWGVFKARLPEYSKK